MKKILTLFVTVLLLTACNKDFLDLNPNDRPSSGTFWETESDYKMALTACYGAMQHPHFAQGLPTWDNLTDNAYGQHNEGQYGMTIGLSQGNVYANSEGFVSNVYTYGLKAVMRANIFLRNLEVFSGIDANTKKRNEAEARMIRFLLFLSLPLLWRCTCYKRGIRFKYPVQSQKSCY